MSSRGFVRNNVQPVRSLDELGRALAVTLKENASYEKQKDALRQIRQELLAHREGEANEEERERLRQKACVEHLLLCCKNDDLREMPALLDGIQHGTELAWNLRMLVSLVIADWPDFDQGDLSASMCHAPLSSAVVPIARDYACGYFYKVLPLSASSLSLEPVERALVELLQQKSLTMLRVMFGKCFRTPHRYS